MHPHRKDVPRHAELYVLYSMEGVGFVPSLLSVTTDTSATGCAERDSF